MSPDLWDQWIHILSNGRSVCVTVALLLYCAPLFGVCDWGVSRYTWSKEFNTGFSWGDDMLLWRIVTLGEIFRCYSPYLTIPSFILTSFAAVSPQPSPEWASWVIEAITYDGWSPYQDFSSVSRFFCFYLGARVPVGGSQEFTLWPFLCRFGITLDLHCRASHRVTPFAGGLVANVITKRYCHLPC